MWAPWSNTLIEGIADCSVRAVFVAVIAGVALAALRVRDANVRHRTWTLVLAAMLGMPVLGWVLPTIDSPLLLPVLKNDEPTVVRSDAPAVIAERPLSRSAEIVPRISVAAEQVTEPTVSRVAEVANPSAEPMANEPVAWAVIIAGAYLVVVVALLARVGVGVVLARRMARRGRRLTSADHPAFTGGVVFLESSELRTPATVGVWRPVILLPSDWRSWSAESLQLAVAHEAFHVRRRDALVTLAANVNVALYWFHPLSWFLRWRLADLAERVCDDEVLRLHGDHAGYAETLLAMASRLAGSGRVSPLVVPMARRAEVETRIEAIIDDARPLCRRLGKRGVALLLAIALPLVVYVAALGPASSAPAAEADADERREATKDFNAEQGEATNPTRQRGEEQTTNLTNDMNKEASRQRERPETANPIITNSATFTDSTGKTKILIVELPKSLHSDGSRQQTLDALKAQGYEAKLSADKRHDGSPVTNLFITVPAEAAAALVVWEESYSEGGLRPRVVLLDQSGKPIEQKSIPELFLRSESYPPGTTYVSENTNRDFNAEAAKEAEGAEDPLFPTLEEQRAADLAYKLLGVELEKLTPEELERVKAKGYQGGLRVARVSGAQSVHGDLASADILVGLHVWPTESLKQIQEILVRYDMPELTPLKYYVIRKIYGGESRFSGDSKGKDEVVTGRIDVDLSAWAEKEGFKQERLKSWKQDENSTLSLTDPGPVSTAQPRFPGDSDTRATNLLYDGKTFDEWRQMLHSELNPKKRSECLVALGAFGRAGKGQEAAQSILSVADEFNWQQQEPDFGVRGSFGSTCMQQFISLPAEVIVPIILKAADDKNPRIANFAKCAAKSLMNHVWNAAKLDTKHENQLKSKFPDIKSLVQPRGRGVYYQDIVPPDRPDSSSPTWTNPLSVSIVPINKKPLAGSRNTYQVFLENNSNVSVEQAVIRVTFPPELVPDMATIKAPVGAELVGDEVRFHSIAMLRPNELVVFQITASLLRAGEGEIVAKFKSKGSPEKEVRQAVAVVDK